MKLEYNVRAPDTWEKKAREYFMTSSGSHENALLDGGAASMLIEFVEKTTEGYPIHVNQAWKFMVTSILNRLPLLDMAWEDAYVRLTADPTKMCRLEFIVRMDENEEQTIFSVMVGTDATAEWMHDVPQWKKVDVTSVNRDNVYKDFGKADIIQSAIQSLLVDYYSPSYRTVTKPDDNCYFTTNEAGDLTCMRKIFSKGSQLCPTGIWRVEVETPALSEAFVENYKPVDFDEEEAELFFGITGQRPVMDTVKDFIRSTKRRILHRLGLLDDAYGV